jgi:uncharacterized protein (DUF433 family)
MIAVNQIEPKLGEGIYLVKDVAKILKIDYKKTYRWIVDYWGNSLDENIKYTFGDGDNRAINFYSLIEFYTFFKLREQGASAQQIRHLHHELSARLNTQYPFAANPDIFIEKRKNKKNNSEIAQLYYDSFGALFKVRDKTQQPYLKFFEQFLNKIEFDENNLARRFFPLQGSTNVVVDPKRQFGQPTIEGTNIKVSTIYNYHLGGERSDSIANMYDLNIAQINDAITFSKAA